MEEYVRTHVNSIITEVIAQKEAVPANIQVTVYGTKPLSGMKERYDQILTELQAYKSSLIRSASTLSELESEIKGACCHLCQHHLNDTTDNLEVDCGHSFHNDCLALRRPDRCPTCKARIEEGYLDLIANLPQPNTCEICLEPLLSEKYHTLFCKHLFHIFCLKQDYGKKLAIKECPKCLLPLDEFDKNEMKLLLAAAPPVGKMPRPNPA